MFLKSSFYHTGKKHFCLLFTEVAVTESLHQHPTILSLKAVLYLHSGDEQSWVQFYNAATEQHHFENAFYVAFFSNANKT